MKTPVPHVLSIIAFAAATSTAAGGAVEQMSPRDPPALEQASAKCADPDSAELMAAAGKHRFGAWLGAGTLSNLGGLEDHETDGRLSILLGVRYSRVVLRRESYTLGYFGELLPVTLETNAIVGEPGAGGLTGRKTVYGFGISPLGARFVFRPSERWRPFIGGSGGFMFFSEDVPIPGARSFTYTGDMEGGVELHLANGHTVIGGIRFHHVSNANSGDVNPGLNTFALYAGFAFSR